MDIVVRRRSAQLKRRYISESIDDDDDHDKPNRKKFREIQDYRRWEWSHLQVHMNKCTHFVFIRFFFVNLQFY